VLGLHFHYFDSLTNQLPQVLSGEVGGQQIFFKQAPVKQVFNLKLYHVSAMFYHFHLLSVDFVRLKELNENVSEVYYTVQRCHHFV
jgi:hypothetical protein